MPDINDKLKELQEAVAAEDLENEKVSKQQEIADDAEDIAEIEQQQADAEPDAAEDKADEELEKDEKKPKSGNEYAKKRKEEAAARKAEANRIAELEAQLEAAKSVPKATEQPKAEAKQEIPDRETNYEGWLEWQIAETQKQNQLLTDYVRQDAEQKRIEAGRRVVVEALERDAEAFKAEAPDLEHAQSYMEKELGKFYRMQGVNAADVKRTVAIAMAELAAPAVKNGKNAAQALYDYAIDVLGYEPQDVVEETQEKKTAEIDYDRLASNRNRNAGTVAAKARANAPLSFDRVAKMTPAQLSKLSPEELGRYLKQAAGG